LLINYVLDRRRMPRIRLLPSTGARTHNFTL